MRGSLKAKSREELEKEISKDIKKIVLKQYNQLTVRSHEVLILNFLSEYIRRKDAYKMVQSAKEHKDEAGEELRKEQMISADGEYKITVMYYKHMKNMLKAINYPWFTSKENMKICIDKTHYYYASIERLN